MPNTRSMSAIAKEPPRSFPPLPRKTKVLNASPLSLSALLDSAAAREQQLHVEAASPTTSIMQNAVLGELRDSESVVNSLIKDMATTAARAFLKDEPQELCVCVSAEDSNMPLQYWIGLMTDQHGQLVFKLDELVKDLEAMKTKCAYHDGLIEAQDGYREMHEGKLKHHGAYLKQFSNGMHNQLEEGLLVKERLEELEDKMVSLTGAVERRAEYINCGFEDFDQRINSVTARVDKLPDIASLEETLTKFDMTAAAHWGLEDIDKRLKDVTARFDKLPDFGLIASLEDTLAKFDTTTRHLLARMNAAERSITALGASSTPTAWHNTLMDRVAKIEAHLTKNDIVNKSWAEWGANVDERTSKLEERHDELKKVGKHLKDLKEKLKNSTKWVELSEITPDQGTRLSELEGTVAQLNSDTKCLADMQADLSSIACYDLKNDAFEKVKKYVDMCVQRLSVRMDATQAVVTDLGGGVIFQKQRDE